MAVIARNIVPKQSSTWASLSGLLRFARNDEALSAMIKPAPRATHPRCPRHPCNLRLNHEAAASDPRLPARIEKSSSMADTRKHDAE
jgi:hypothetical protein